MKHKNLTHRLIKHRHARTLTALIALDIGYFVFVDPREAMALSLFIGFALVAISIIAVAYIIHGRIAVSYEHARRATYYLAGMLIVMIGLQSVGQLTPRDVITLLPFVAGVYWYIGHQKQNAAQTPV